MTIVSFSGRPLLVDGSMQNKRKEMAEKAIGFATSVVLVPVAMSAAGMPWFVVLALALFLTLCVWAWAFKPDKIVYIPILAVAALFCAWAIRREVAYHLTYQLCRNQTLEVVSGDPRLAVYEFGARLFNDTGRTLFMRVDDQSFSLGRRAADPPLNQRPFPVYPGTRNLVISSVISYVPAIPIAKVNKGHVRFVIKYGRDPDALTKRLIISGDVNRRWLQNGDTAAEFVPDRDSDAPISFTKVCRFAPQQPSA